MLKHLACGAEDVTSDHTWRQVPVQSVKRARNQGEIGELLGCGVTNSKETLFGRDNVLAEVLNLEEGALIRIKNDASRLNCLSNSFTAIVMWIVDLHTANRSQTL